MYMVKLLGNRKIYGKLFNNCERKHLERFKEVLSSYGVIKVIAKEQLDTSNFSVYNNSLIILPVINNCVYASQGKFTYDGTDWVYYNNVVLQMGTPIIYNEKIIGHRLDTATILYFNPFPFVPRITPFKSILKFIFDQKQVIKRQEFTKEQLVQKNIEIFTSSLKNKVNENNRILHRKEEDINTYQQYILDKLREISILTIENSAIKNFTDNMQTEFLNKFRELENSKIIQKVELQTDGIYIDFGVIEIKYKEKTHLIGNIVATITPDKIRFSNKSHDKKGYQHPHISSGNACFGTYGKDVFSLLNKMELSKLVFLLAQFLRTYNDSSTYIKIGEWK